MAFWDTWYQREEAARLLPGDYRAELVAAEETKSKSGKNMLVVTVRPCGAAVTIRDYMVEGAWFNRNLTAFKDSFGIAERDNALPGWIGAVGAVQLAEDENGYLRVKRYLTPERAERLPAWQGKPPERQTVTTFEDVDDDLPFTL